MFNNDTEELGVLRLPRLAPLCRAGSFFSSQGLLSDGSHPGRLKQHKSVGATFIRCTPFLSP